MRSRTLQFSSPSEDAQNLDQMPQNGNHYRRATPISARSAAVSILDEGSRSRHLLLRVLGRR
jgi:hypothetical protein